MSISGSLCGFFSMILIRSPFDTKSKFAISSELKISDTKRKTNNVKQKNGSSNPKKRGAAEGTNFNKISTLIFSNVSAQGFDWLGQRISDNGSVVFPFWRTQCQKVATS